MKKTDNSRPVDAQNYYESVKPSEAVKAFLDWLSEKEEEQKNAQKLYDKEDARVTDFLHEMEFEGNSKARAKIATRLHNSRVERRKAKDIADTLKPIKDFMYSMEAKTLNKKLRKLAADLQIQEDYVASAREYRPRVRDSEE